ncbi:MAG: amidohydrolase family protein [Candidatus Azobacteroides sp.]|nr:amidohydrolase family protein [Candidatus Azobacteroides sp.]
MDEAGVEKTVLFSTMVHPERTTDLSGFRKEMQRLNEIIGGQANTAVAARLAAIKEQKETIDLYPTRFIGFGTVPLTLNTENVVNEYIEKEVIENGFVGLGEFTLPSGSIKLLKPVFKASTNYGNLPLWIHAFNPLTLQDIKEIAQCAEDFPSVPVIIGHLGGSNWLETIELVKKTPNLYLDISAYFSTLVLKMAIHALPSKCIFGVDMPYGDLQLALDAVRKLSNDDKIADAVLGENILALLPHLNFL